MAAIPSSGGFVRKIFGGVVALTVLIVVFTLLIGSPVGAGHAIGSFIGVVIDSVKAVITFAETLAKDLSAHKH